MHEVLCFLTTCKYRDDEGDCKFTGKLIISLEGDCQCAERRVEVRGTVIENISRKFNGEEV